MRKSFPVPPRVKTSPYDCAVGEWVPVRYMGVTSDIPPIWKVLLPPEPPRYYAFEALTDPGLTDLGFMTFERFYYYPFPWDLVPCTGYRRIS